MSDHPQKPPNQSGISLSYKDAGVDIDAGNRLIERIKPLAASTQRAGMLAGLGGFGGLFELPPGKYQQPVFVSGTDGVGTKLKLAIALQQHDTIGIDLVAMCVNDIIVSGAEPLFFLDYFACGQLEIDVAEQVVAGIAQGCRIAGAGLIGGETAEMPGVYQGKDYDLAGFCVGVVEKSEIIDGQQVQAGDVLLGLHSSGPHSNGYSLINRILQTTHADIQAPFGTSTLGATLLAPTTIYVKDILALRDVVPIKAIAHITGGGLPENVPRVLPAGLSATIHQSSWEIPEIFHWLQQQGGIAQHELLRTFNCGIGLVVCVAAQHQQAALELLTKRGLAVSTIGEIEPQAPGQPATVVV